MVTSRTTLDTHPVTPSAYRVRGTVYIYATSETAHRTPVAALFGRKDRKMNSLTVRQNYHEESEQRVNDHINVELCAFYTYLSMVSSLLLIYYN